MKKKYLVLGGCKKYKIDKDHTELQIIDGEWEEADKLGVELSFKIINQFDVINENDYETNKEILEAYAKQEFYIIHELDEKRVRGILGFSSTEYLSNEKIKEAILATDDIHSLSFVISQLCEGES